MQVSILMVRALVGAVERAGASREQFLAAAGIDQSLIDDGKARLSLGEYLRALLAALAVADDPAFGLHLGEHASPVMFDVLGPLAERAATLRESIEASARYSPLLAEGHASQLCETGDTASVRFPSLHGDLPVVRVTAEFAMGAFLQLLQLFVGPDARPTKVLFMHDAPAYLEEYTRIFGGAERFGQAFTGIEFPSAWLDRAQPYKSPDLYALLRAEAERHLDRLERDAALTQRIKLILTSRNPREVTMEDVARELGMSARSLRRRLITEGVKYGELVEQSRLDAAKRMLEDPRATIQETAYVLGFATPSAFHRAFKRWTGKTPKQYRASF